MSDKVSTTSPSVANAEQGGFLRHSGVMFGLCFLALGGIVLLYFKFRAMDKQVRLLTKQVAEVPSEADFRMAQESWATQFYAKHEEQSAKILSRLDALSQMAEATRTQLSQLEARDASPVNASTQFTLTSLDLEGVQEDGEGVQEDGEGVQEDGEGVQEDGEGVQEDGEEDGVTENEPVEEQNTEVENETVQEPEEIAQAPVSTEEKEDDGDDNDMPDVDVTAAPEPESQAKSCDHDHDNCFPIPNKRPVFINKPLESPKAEPEPSTDDTKEEVLESSLDLDGDESEFETESN